MFETEKAVHLYGKRKNRSNHQQGHTWISTKGITPNLRRRRLNPIMAPHTLPHTSPNPLHQFSCLLQPPNATSQRQRQRQCGEGYYGTPQAPLRGFLGFKIKATAWDPGCLGPKQVKRQREAKQCKQIASSNLFTTCAPADPYN